MVIRSLFLDVIVTVAVSAGMMWGRCGHEQRLDALVVQPGKPRLGQPALQVLAQRPVRGERPARQGPRHERPDAGPRRDEPLVLQLPVRLEDGVRVDGELRHPRP
ncbi:hypothetical protein ACQPZP_07245 [Spirillospora sp. CA-142024]|uniref:hypothetical protein n=1 Tax=Spirillospora sp. CA-142024 TaxID=3240036 RepID=UPI003D8D1360